MISVKQVEEPSSFNKSVREPGRRAIAEMVGETPPRKFGRRFSKIAERREDIPGSRFPPYWRKCIEELMEAYNQVCAYSCIRIHPVTGSSTVDHMVPKSRKWDRVYEWDNYRLACSLLNSRKNNYEDVLDPFNISSGWFHLDLVGFNVKPNPELSYDLKKGVDNTIETLKLNDFRKSREEHACLYWEKHVSLKVLTLESPFVAYELRRQGRLNNEDKS